MMIKAGDLVQVISWPCCANGLGVIFYVSSVYKVDPQDTASCGYCGQRHKVSRMAEGQGRYTVAAHWLKRIPPLSELESEKERQEMTA